MSASTEAQKLILRLPDGLREQIKNAAKHNHRSMNADVVHHLERIYQSEPLATASKS
ncbi:Arc family DNA-binding protein [Rhizobium hidalgonense]|uniref:Arc family DNA-binding protein n=1 Tax=Rhizobium hidalgonense TaxID=1538159 RepID=UPI0035C68518